MISTLAGLLVIIGALIAGFFVLGPMIVVNNWFGVGSALDLHPATPSLEPGAVAQSTPGPVPTLAPTVTPIPSATPSPTPVPPTGTPTPRPTATRTPTSVASPTATATATPAPTATPTPTPTSSPTARPSPRPTRPRPTATPRPAATPTLQPAPQLLSPADGQRFADGDVITLAWQPARSLPANGFYRLFVEYTHQGEAWLDAVDWLQATRWNLSDHAYLLALSDDTLYRWSVQVMLKTGTNAQGRPVGTPLSARSSVRSLFWVPAGPSPTPIPP